MTAGRRAVGWVVVGAGLALAGPARPALGGESRAKLAAAASHPSSEGHIRQLAFDGKPDTYHESDAPARVDDYLRFDFDHPVTARSLAVDSGRPDGTNLVTRGALEVSADGTTFRSVADFDAQGHAAAAPAAEALKEPIRAVRVRVTAELGHPLAIREFRIDAEDVRPFDHPVEFTVNSQDAPDLQTWTEETARLCEQWYDFLSDELPSDGYRPTDHIALTMRRSYNGVAAAGGGRITGSVRYFERHRDDRGAFIHETVHIIQNYRGRGNPGWLVEGVADYVRWFLFEPGKAGPVNPKTAKYDASYRTTAAFLDYLSRTYDKEIVRKLNRAMRAGTYKPELFREYTGKPVETLGDEWRASLQPKN